MSILIINPGSTAVKYTLFDESGVVLDKKKFENLDEQFNEQKEWLSKLTNVGKIGIRIVHAGNLTKPTMIDEKVIKQITTFKQFAPIHNKIALEVISLIREILKDVPMVTVFDTAFHTQIPKYASTYPIPHNLTKKYSIRKYGFHGIALKSVLEQVDNEFEKSGATKPRRVILAHLGGGSTIAAVQDGVSLDTTMGLTPLDGIMMKTRSGSVDPDLPKILTKLTGKNIDEISDILNTQSGFFGITDSGDIKDIIEKAQHEDGPERLAFDIFVHQIIKQIFAYYGVLQGCDALVFSGGIGANNTYLREIITDKITLLINQNKIFTFKSDEAGEIFKTVLKLKSSTDRK